jgi:hypothetical protein
MTMTFSRKLGSISLTALALSTMAACGSDSGNPPSKNPIPTGPNELTGSPSTQGCKFRLSGHARGPRGVPKLPGTKFQSAQPTAGVYAGYVAGTANARSARRLHAEFAAGKLHPTSVTTTGTASVFSFNGKNKQGTVTVAVLCQGHLRVLYQYQISTTPPTIHATAPPSS